MKDVFNVACYSRLAHFNSGTHSMYVYNEDKPDGADDFFSNFKSPIEIINHPLDVRNFDKEIDQILESSLTDKIRQHGFYSSWLAHIRKNCMMIANLVNENKIVLSLETEPGAVRFHQDGPLLKARLICTYKGPGMEWLHRANVDTMAEYLGFDNFKIVKDWSKVQRMSEWATGIFCGGEDGVFHRSPPPIRFNEKGEINRVVLRLNADLL